MFFCRTNIAGMTYDNFIFGKTRALEHSHTIMPFRPKKKRGENFDRKKKCFFKNPSKNLNEPFFLGKPKIVQDEDPWNARSHQRGLRRPIDPPVVDPYYYHCTVYTFLSTYTHMTCTHTRINIYYYHVYIYIVHCAQVHINIP